MHFSAVVAPFIPNIHAVFSILCGVVWNGVGPHPRYFLVYRGTSKLTVGAGLVCACGLLLFAYGGELWRVDGPFFSLEFWRRRFSGSLRGLCWFTVGNSLIRSEKECVKLQV